MKKLILALAAGLIASTAHAGAANWRIYRCVQSDGHPITLRFSMGMYPGNIMGSTQNFDTFYDVDSDADVMVYPDRDHPQRVITIKGVNSSDRIVGGASRSMSCGRPIYR